MPTGADTSRATNPGRFVVLAFAAAILVGTVLLLSPFATEEGTTGLLDALFTATSAVCVTGLIVVDTPTHWTTFGELAILGLIQLGGFGIMTLSSLVALVLSRRLGLRQRVRAQAETQALDLGDVRRVVLGVAAFSVVFESVAAVLLTWRFWTEQDVSLTTALYRGVFHAISAFNNAGFSLFSDSLAGWGTDAWVLLTVATAVVLGGLGFPVLIELRANPRRPSRWSIHTKFTVGTTAVLIVIGAALITTAEWSNGDTIGGLASHEKVLNGLFHAVMPRTAGFHSMDVGLMREESLLVTDALMLIGGGSASTAGGIKVTTFALLGFVVWAELRGDPDVNAFGRRIPTPTQRQALTIVLMAIGAVITATFALLATSEIALSHALFEALSAFSTVGLSTGVTPDLSAASHAVLVALMFLGRVGPITLFAALVLRERARLYRFPHERPIIG
jgi:trk system potassium uptake protein TrkH